ncbi:MAG: DEAD/DEAH box helicase [Blautia sp.]|nr:DEAD/DEAH box helicase [Blautia sp.]MCM1201144.1 DEAD/DEAH box helicase [Bacteroides fragilis]
MKKELYDWQEECLARWLANNGQGIVQAVTGSGKTLLALTASDLMEKKLKQDLRIKIIVPTNSLMQQWKQAVKGFLSDTHKESGLPVRLQKEPGLRGGGSQSDPDHKYMIYVINSARYELARQILAELKQGKAVLLIADECHHYTSAQNQLIFEFIPYIEKYRDRFFSLGLSATLPAGEPQRYLTSVLGRKIYDYGMEEASAKATICPYNIYHISLSFSNAERWEYEELSERMAYLFHNLLKAFPVLGKFSQGKRYEFLQSLSGNKNRKIAETAAYYLQLSYKRKSLVCLASARISCASDLIRQLDPNEKILIFSERISQADELFQLLQESYAEKVGRYHSKMGKQANKNVLERFRTGQVRILIACKAIDEGLDVPDASIGIVMSGTSVKRQRIQRLGRIIRKNNSNKRAAMYYLHIEETSEDSCFLPDINKHHLTELQYDDKNRAFLNPDYDARAALLLDNMKNTHADRELLSEAERCLRSGSIRSDWLLEKSAIEEQIQKARYISDKNYWVCMKKLSQISIHEI